MRILPQRVAFGILLVISATAVYAQTELRASLPATKLASVLWAEENLVPMGASSFRKTSLEPLMARGLSSQAAEETEIALKRFLVKLSTNEEMRTALALALDEAYSEQELNIIATKASSVEAITVMTAEPKFLDAWNELMAIAFEEHGETFRDEAIEILRKHVKPKKDG